MIHYEHIFSHERLSFLLKKIKKSICVIPYKNKFNNYYISFAEYLDELNNIWSFVLNLKISIHDDNKNISDCVSLIINHCLSNKINIYFLNKSIFDKFIELCDNLNINKLLIKKFNTKFIYKKKSFNIYHVLTYYDKISPKVRFNIRKSWEKYKYIYLTLDNNTDMKSERFGSRLWINKKNGEHMSIIELANVCHFCNLCLHVFNHKNAYIDDIEVLGLGKDLNSCFIILDVL